MKQMTEIVSGKFTTGENAKGNFTAYDANGERFFIHKSQMESAGLKSDKDIKFPLFAITDEKEIQTRDANGELTDVLVKRAQALSIFKSEDEMINAFNSSARLAIKAKTNLQAVATASGLNQSTINSLLEIA